MKISSFAPLGERVANPAKRGSRVRESFFKAGSLDVRIPAGLRAGSHGQRFSDRGFSQTAKSPRLEEWHPWLPAYDRYGNIPCLLGYYLAPAFSSAACKDTHGIRTILCGLVCP